MKKFRILLIVFFATAGLLRAAAFTTVGNLYLSGGQYFFGSEPSSVGGNSSIYLSPVINFSRTNALVPVVNIDYRGTSDVRELVGGGTLTRQSADGGLTLKYIHRFEPVKTKVRVSYKKSLINETKDESWGEGLFDYDRLLYGFELQKEISGWETSLSFDYYRVDFLNYSSLVYSSKYEESIDSTTYREISKNAGKNVLDYSNTAIEINVENRDPVKDMDSFIKYRLDLRNYDDQTIVQNDGSFSKSLRKDSVSTLALGIDYKLKRTKVTLETETKLFNSNQNSYDANATKFIDNYYSYYSAGFSPELSFYIGKPSSLSKLQLWWAIEYRKYFDRPAQEADADYINEVVFQRDNILGISYSYPVFEDFYATAKINRRVVTSNNKYEANYKYNYTVANYFLGLNWQFGM